MFLGHSSHYATIIDDILNLKAHHISPQFHVMYDAWLTTTYSDRNIDPEKWEHLFLLHCKQVALSLDEVANIQLANEWLDTDELLLHQQKEQHAQLPTLHPMAHPYVSFFQVQHNSKHKSPIYLQHEFYNDDTLPEYSSPSTEGAPSQLIPLVIKPP